MNEIIAATYLIMLATSFIPPVIHYRRKGSMYECIPVWLMTFGILLGMSLLGGLAVKSVMILIGRA